jgi:hypothetical protein
VRGRSPSFAAVILWVMLPLAFECSAQVISALYQAPGAALALVGLVVAISQRAREAAGRLERSVIATAHRLRVALRSLRRRVDHAMATAVVWILRRPQPIVVELQPAIEVSSAMPMSWSIEPRERVDRETITDREWLIYLDDHLTALWDGVGTGAKRSRDELAAQEAELRAEIRTATRGGWQRVVAGTDRVVRRRNRRPCGLGSPTA